MYYNTNNEKHEVLDRSERKAKRQEDLILDFFLRNPGVLYTPFEVREMLNLNCPITSVRRAITNLENQGKLTKTDTMKNGIYGKKNHTWKLYIPEESGQMRLAI